MTSRRLTVALLLALLAGAVGLGTALAKTPRPDPEKYFASKDIRLHLPHPDDMTGWTQVKDFDAQKEANLVLRLVLKKPDSSDPFDAIIEAEGFEQKGNIKFTNNKTGEETTISAGSVQQIADFLVASNRENFKDIRDEEKLRKAMISRSVGKGYVWKITGMQEGLSLPVHRRLYAFGVNGKTYMMWIVMTTNTLKNEAIVKTVEKMIGSMIAWKP
jgi:hypothetical protein